LNLPMPVHEAEIGLPWKMTNYIIRISVKSLQISDKKTYNLKDDTPY
jgi:hypothetical protein